MSGQEYLSQATFEVKIDNVKTDNFINVSGLGVELEDLRGKDESGKTTVNTPGSSNARDITLVRRFSGDKSLHDWFAEVRAKGNNVKRRTGSIRVLDTEQKQVAQYDFEGAWIKAWMPPELSKDAGGNTHLVETVVLSVTDLKMV